MNKPPPTGPTPGGPSTPSGPSSGTGPLPETITRAGATLRLVNTADPDEYVDDCGWCRRGLGDSAPAYRYDDDYCVIYLHPECTQAADRQARIIAHLRALRPLIDAYTQTDHALTASRLWSPAPDPVLQRTRDGHAAAVARRVATLVPLLERDYTVDLDDATN